MYQVHEPFVACERSRTFRNRRNQPNRQTASLYCGTCSECLGSPVLTADQAGYSLSSDGLRLLRAVRDLAHQVH